MAFLGDGGQDGGDQFGVGRQRHIFLGSGLDGADCRLGVAANATGDDRHDDALGSQAVDQSGDVLFDVDHHQVGALAAAQLLQTAFDILSLRHLGAAGYGDLRSGADLAVEGSDDE